jgi:hydrophobic/amphiphilic exporter-1 (mainly G- bacteria), HAE1 family
MNISKPFIRRPVMTTLVMVPLIIFGIFAYLFLPVATIPYIPSATIEVTASYPSASPSDMARLVAGPLERQFMLMEGIQFVASSNDYEQTTIILQFHDGINIEVAAEETQNAIYKAQGQLPSDLPNPPVYTKTNPSDTPILFAVVHSDTIPDTTLYDWGYTFVGQQLGTVEGVANITTYGYPYAVRVQVSPESLAAKGISLGELADAVVRENPDLPTGSFYGRSQSMVNNVAGQLYTAEEYNKVIIKYQDGSPVRVEDIGKAIPSLQNDKMSFKWITPPGKEEAVVVLAIFKQPGYNTVKVCQQLKALMDKLRLELPPTIKLDIPFDQAIFIEQSVEEVEFTLLLSFVLVVIVVFIYLGKARNSIIPLITLPITITGTFIIMYLIGYSIDIMSMSALTLAIGFLVDDAIVVLENIVRWVQGGEEPYQGAMKGSAQIIITVVSISICLCMIFVPMLFLTGTIGKIFHEFAAVILIAVIFSAFISLSLTPMLCSRFVPPYEHEKKTKMEKFSDRLNENLLKVYKPALSWALRHKTLIFLFCVVNLLLSVWLFVKLPKEFLPPDDLGCIQGFAVAQQGTSPDRMQDYVDQITKICIQNKYVASIARMKSTPTDNQAMFFITLVEGKRPTIWQVMTELQSNLKDVIGSHVFLKAFPLINLQIGNITAAKANYQYILQGVNQKDLYATAEQILDKLRTVPELAQVSSDMQIGAPIVDVALLRDQARSYGDLSAQDIEDAIMYAYGEKYISKMNETQNMYYVIVQALDRDVEYPSQTNRLYLGNGDHQVAIDSVINKELAAGLLEINHINTLPSVTIAFNVAPGYALSEALQAFQVAADPLLPRGIMGHFAGNTSAFKTTFLQMTILLIVALFVVYLILGILYENFIYPLPPLSSLPVAALGGFITLIIFNQALSIYALIGIFMLLGIVLKNGILVIDFALEEMRDHQKSPEEAALRACLIRFRPIIMTTLAAVMGAVPIAMGVGGTVAKGRAPLGMVVVGGLLFAQLITLFVLPVFFVVTCKIHNFFTTRFELFKEHEPVE